MRQDPQFLHFPYSDLEDFNDLTGRYIYLEKIHSGLIDDRYPEFAYPIDPRVAKMAFAVPMHGRVGNRRAGWLHQNLPSHFFRIERVVHPDNLLGHEVRPHAPTAPEFGLDVVRFKVEPVYHPGDRRVVDDPDTPAPDPPYRHQRWRYYLVIHFDFAEVLAKATVESGVFGDTADPYDVYGEMVKEWFRLNKTGDAEGDPLGVDGDPLGKKGFKFWPKGRAIDRDLEYFIHNYGPPPIKNIFLWGYAPDGVGFGVWGLTKWRFERVYATLVGDRTVLGIERGTESGDTAHAADGGAGAHAADGGGEQRVTRVRRSARFMPSLQELAAQAMRRADPSTLGGKVLRKEIRKLSGPLASFGPPSLTRSASAYNVSKVERPKRKRRPSIGGQRSRKKRKSHRKRRRKRRRRRYTRKRRKTKRKRRRSRQ